MLINKSLNIIQQILKPLYDKSFILQNIDRLIGLNIFLVIFSSTVAQSDTIGYFALFAVILYSPLEFSKTSEASAPPFIIFLQSPYNVNKP